MEIFMDLVCVITGIMFSDVGPLTTVELLKICLSQWLWRKCSFFLWDFVVWQELARIPTAPVFWEKEEACRYLTSVQGEWLPFWPFTQNLEFSWVSSQAGEVVSEAGDQLRRELTREQFPCSSFLTGAQPRNGPCSFSPWSLRSASFWECSGCCPGC